MKITDIRAMRLKVPTTEAPAQPKPRRPGWAADAEVANPMSRFPKVKRHRSLWLPRRWEAVWCQVTLEDGTTGLGNTGHGRVSAALIEDHLAPQLKGEDGLAIDRLADMMFRLTTLITVDFAERVEMSPPESLANLKRWHGEISSRPSAEA